MFSAARFIFLGLLAGAGALLGAAEATSRTVPTRPPEAARVAAVGIKKFGAIDYVNVADMANRLALKLAWTERGRKLTLRGASAHAELEADTRDIVVNGLRVFLGSPVVGAGGKLYVSKIDYERCLTPLLRPGFGVAALQRPQVIVLDPGHGGNDPGKINGKLAVDEKTLALDVARRAQKILEAAGYRVLLTRERDINVEHADRAALANVERADIFVSIHFNALENDTRTQGVEVYTFPPRFQNSTNSWSPGKKADAETEASPGNALDHWNVVLAQALQRELVTGLKAPDRGKKLMQLKVLRPLKCPGVLVECGFLTSETEALKIATPQHREKIAELLAAGVRTYAATIAALHPKTPAASQGGRKPRPSSG